MIKTIKQHKFKRQIKILETFTTKIVEKYLTDKFQGKAQSVTRKDRTMGSWIRMPEMRQGRTIFHPVSSYSYLDPTAGLSTKL
jgi:hypothetical protein